MSSEEKNHAHLKRWDERIALFLFLIILCLCGYGCADLMVNLITNPVMDAVTEEQPSEPPRMMN